MRHTLAVLLALGSVVALPGCGGGGDGGGAVPTTGQPAATTRAAATPARTTPVPAATKDPTFTGSAGRKRFDAVVTAACSAITQGLPQAPPGRPTPTALRTYDAALGLTADRLAEALRRLAAQRPTSRVSLQAVAKDARRLREAATTAAASANKGSAVQDQVAVAAGELRRTARDKGLPECGV